MDPLNLDCPCCSVRIDPRTVVRCAVNICKWSWAGIDERGEKFRNEGETGYAKFWILNEPDRKWRKLFVRAMELGDESPALQRQQQQHFNNNYNNDEEVYDERPVPIVASHVVSCSLCRNEIYDDEKRSVAGKILCVSCHDVVQEGLQERDKKREEEEEVKKKERSAKIERVALPGLGESPILKKTRQNQN
eukprot:TRINITY_DN2220_c0_g1_i3.p1 TRINITY_DN2220_c0_g1~~TRINITY_DN2220_c0_g1_i3.p1  ORF type:complete len:191 (-),score=56.69 TRINITY_DN2220_c0_g1_i3:33-605(-)